MKVRNMTKRIAAVCLVLAIGMGGMSGCQSRTKIVFTTGLSGNQLFKIGSAVCTMPEIMIYLTTFYNQYADIYGPEMWHYDFGGVSLEEHVKDVVLSKMAQIKIMNLMAGEHEITLNEEEEKKVLAAAGAYYDKLGETLKKEEGITKEIAEKVYREYTLAIKVYETITESADMEISDDEARTVMIQAIYLKNWQSKDGEKTALNETEALKVRENADNALARIRAGEDFETVAAQVSDDKQITRSFARGDVEAQLEEILFSMDEGDISDVIETSEGYYILKCISTMDYEATQANKIVLAEQRKRDAFSEAYTEIAANTHSQLRDKRWERLTLNEEIHSTDADFFDIYDEYIKQ